MRAKKMMQYCDAALSKLEDLEGMLPYLAEEHDGYTFIVESRRAVIELSQIAMWETAHNVTVAQASHIRRILSKSGYLWSLVAEDAEDGCGEA